MQSCGNNPTSDSDACSTAGQQIVSETEPQSTVSIEIVGLIDPYRFNMFVADLLAERGRDIKRMSGVLSVQVSVLSAWQVGIVHEHFLWMCMKRNCK